MLPGSRRGVVSHGHRGLGAAPASTGFDRIARSHGTATVSDGPCGSRAGVLYGVGPKSGTRAAGAPTFASKSRPGGLARLVSQPGSAAGRVGLSWAMVPSPHFPPMQPGGSAPGLVPPVRGIPASLGVEQARERAFGCLRANRVSGDDGWTTAPIIQAAAIGAVPAPFVRARRGPIAGSGCAPTLLSCPLPGGEWCCLDRRLTRRETPPSMMPAISEDGAIAVARAKWSPPVDAGGVT